MGAQTIIAFLKRLVQQRREKDAVKLQSRLKVQYCVRAAVRIQTTVRRWLAQKYLKRLRNRQKEFNASLLKLQCWFRRCLAKERCNRARMMVFNAKQLRALHEVWSRAATNLQRVFRAHRGRITVLMLRGDKKAARELDRQGNRTHAAVIIQKHWRGHMVRKLTHNTLAQRNRMRRKTLRSSVRSRAALIIQRLYRGYRVRQKYPHLRQKCARAVRKKKQVVREEAALTIQRCARRMFARTRANEMRTLRSARALSEMAKPRLPFVYDPYANDDTYWL